MKKTLLLIVSALALFNFGAKAQTYTDQATSVNWVLNSNPPAQAVVAPEEAFSSTAIAAGANLPFLDTRTTTGVTYLRVQPSAQIESPNATHAITFTIIPSAGLTFTPTNISFATYRYGTDGGSVKVTGKKASDAAETELVAEFKPNRDNSGSPTEINQSISGIAVAGEAWTVTLYVYSLGNTKQIGLSNFIISGTVNGTRQQITQYTITASVNPEGAGSITLTPPAAQYDENTVVTLATSKNFGYQFVNWTDGSGNTLSAATSFQHTVTSNIAITANYTAIPVYELNVDVQGGAKEYMISYSPQPTVLNNKKMYEDGVNVTLTAENRPILLFTNWENGETSPERTVAMTENRDITAIYAVQDYVAGWDFHYAGNGSRSADFYSTTENQAATLVLRNAAGGTQSWLDKSTVAAGGYEGRPAAVNWKNLSDNYYYQLSFNAADFQNLSIRSAMLYNYNAYSVQKLEYSLNGTDFTQIGQFTMTAEKVWYDETFALPADANNAPVVYIRWIPDYASALVGTNSTNDGTSLSGIYIFGSEAIVNDGTPPVLVSSIPANNATGVSATGRIVLTFDEKVKVAEGTTGSIEMTGNHPAIDLPVYGQVITPAVSGKTITFSYSGLAYNTEYDFVLPANTVSDLGDNVLTSPINIHFTTINRPTVTKKTFDFVVGRDGNFAAALAAANAAQAGGQRFYIFFPDGEYNIGEQTGDANQMTTINIGNLSLVGQSADNTVIYNRSINEAIGTTATVWFSNKQSGNNYLQDLSILNKADYRTGTLTGRHVALRDQSKKAIYKNVNLLSNQDTYYTGDDRSYWENGEIHGTVDFICGGGDIFFNETLLYLEERTGNCITAPATSGNWGYVFSNCTIDGFVVNNNGYRLGRSWQNVPKAVYLNTTMKVLPIAAGWGDPMNVVPSVFAEYNSMTSAGAPVDLTSRRTSYTLDGNTVTRNPILSAEQAANYTIENVLGGTDTWQPTLYTEQAAAPAITGEGSTITWDNNNYVLCWAVFINDVFQTFVTENYYHYPMPIGTMSSNSLILSFTVRAANEMGGLGAPSNTYEYTPTGIDNPKQKSEIVSQRFFTPEGREIASPQSYKGVVIVRSVYANGETGSEKVINVK